jgi:hypothetical protein
LFVEEGAFGEDDLFAHVEAGTEGAEGGDEDEHDGADGHEEHALATAVFAALDDGVGEEVVGALGEAGSAGCGEFDGESDLFGELGGNGKGDVGLFDLDSVQARQDIAEFEGGEDAADFGGGVGVQVTGAEGLSVEELAVFVGDADDPMLCFLPERKGAGKEWVEAGGGCEGGIEGAGEVGFVGLGAVGEEDGGGGIAAGGVEGRDLEAVGGEVVGGEAGGFEFEVDGGVALGGIRRENADGDAEGVGGGEGDPGGGAFEIGLLNGGV